MLKVQKLVHSEFAKLTTQEGDTGYDLYSVDTVIIDPGQTKLVPHGIAVEPEEGYATTIRPRSSALTKTGVHVGFGTVDSSYTGQLFSQVENRTAETIIITPGQRVSQLTVERVFKPEVVYVEELTETSRGAGGFGSTGV